MVVNLLSVQGHRTFLSLRTTYDALPMQAPQILAAGQHSQDPALFQSDSLSRKANLSQSKENEHSPDSMPDHYLPRYSRVSKSPLAEADHTMHSARPQEILLSANTPYGQVSSTFAKRSTAYMRTPPPSPLTFTWRFGETLSPRRVCSQIRNIPEIFRESLS